MAESQRKTANLVDLPTWSNSITDTRVEFQLIIRLYKNSAMVGQSVFNISTLGYFTSYSPVAGSDFDQIYIKHNGSTKDISIIDMPFDGKKNQQLWFSAIALGTNPTTVGGLSLKDIMLNVGDSALPYEPYWKHSLRKLTTATEAVENPLYSDGTAITAYTLKGNEEHTGTPSPSNPITISGVGEKTANLLDWTSFADNYFLDNTTGLPTGYTGAYTRIATLTPIDVSSYNNVTFSFDLPSENGFFIYSLFNGSSLVRRVAGNSAGATIDTSQGDNLYLCVYSTDTNISTSNVSNAMLNEGSTAKPFEPYGYKLPISNGQQTTNIYLGSTQTIRQIKKLVLTGQEDITSTHLDIGLFNLETVTDYNRDSAITCICTHLEARQNVTAFNSVQPNQCAFYISGSSINIFYMRNTAYSTIEDFKQWLADQYAAGTPVTVWYVLTTPETAAVNEPLMKIGTYADTLSNATSIPTTEGANSITVNTIVQPSEFTATWTGWHDSSVKEYDGSDWQ